MRRTVAPRGAGSGPLVLDVAVLSRLAEDVGDDLFVVAVAERYRQLLVLRLQRITDAVRRSEPGDLLDAVLSLKVSSLTIGTCELADLARRLETCVRSGDVAATYDALAQLPQAAARASRALADFLAS